MYAVLLLLSTTRAADHGLLHQQVLFACSSGRTADTELGAIRTEFRSDRLHPRSRGFVVLRLAALLSAGLLAATLGGRAAAGATCSAGPVGLGAGGGGSSAGGRSEGGGAERRAIRTPRGKKRTNQKRDRSRRDPAGSSARRTAGIPLPQREGAQRSPAACRRCPAGRCLRG